MLLSELKNKKIMLWGMGTEGTAVLNYLKNHNISDNIIIYDEADKTQNYDDLIQGIEVMIKSPGVSLYREEIVVAKAKGIKVTSSSDLFLSEMRTNHPQTIVVGISGSKGKSISVSMLYHLLKTSGCKVALGGNIGKALIELLDDEYDVIVGEFSSYQAADLTASPNVVMFTNLFSVHEDWHHGHDNYCKDKIHLAANQKEGDVCFLNSQNEQLMQYGKILNNAKLYNTQEGFYRNGTSLCLKNWVVFDVDDLKIYGNHNIDNFAGVFSIIKYLEDKGIKSINLEAAFEDAKSFEGLSHRLQKVAIKNGILFINDSISTAPEAAIGAMESFEGGIGLVSGGTINHQNYSEYAKYIEANPKVKVVATLFQCGPQIAESIKKYVTRKDFRLIEAQNLEEAVTKVYETLLENKGTTLLFSPTAPSFGYYKNFIERGQNFIDIVNNLK